MFRLTFNKDAIADQFMKGGQQINEQQNIV